jgi:hypothetical protein
MRFPWSFTRSVGSGFPSLPLVECAPPPRGPLGETVAAQYLARDNVLASRQANTSGWPAQRIVLGWFGPSDVEPRHTFSFTSYVFDHRSSCWFESGRKLNVPPFVLQMVDAPVLLDSPTAGRKNGQMTGPQALEVMIVPTADSDMPRGEYTFVVGADVSSTP